MYTSEFVSHCYIKFSTYYIVYLQLIAVQKKLKQKVEATETATRLEQINQLKESEKSKTGSAGLKGTWKKLKGKKKKQRNMTAPEISSQTIAEAARKSQALTTVKEDEGCKEKQLLSDEWSKKGNVNASTGEPNSSPKIRRASVDVNIQRPASQSSNEDTNFSTQKLKTPSTDYLESKSDITQTPNHSATTPPKSAEIVVSDQFSLSQTSGKVSNHSLSQNSCNGLEDHYSSQSSSDIPISTFGDECHYNRGYLSDHHHDNQHIPDWPEGGSGDLKDEVYKKGSLKLYWEFGNKKHKSSLQQVKEFLKSSGENEPVDLDILLDWEGWMLASKEIP